MCKQNQKNSLPSKSPKSSTPTVSFSDLPDERPRRQLDITNITMAELEALRSTDPFMFYSIPADQINLASQHPEGGTNGGGNGVTRRRRISYETVDNGLGELFNDETFMQELSDLNQGANESSQEDIDYLSLLQSFFLDDSEEGSTDQN